MYNHYNQHDEHWMCLRNNLAPAPNFRSHLHSLSCSYHPSGGLVSKMSLTGPGNKKTLSRCQVTRETQGTLTIRDSAMPARRV